MQVFASVSCIATSRPNFPFFFFDADLFLVSVIRHDRRSFFPLKRQREARSRSVSRGPLWPRLLPIKAGSNGVLVHATASHITRGFSWYKIHTCGMSIPWSDSYNYIWLHETSFILDISYKSSNCITSILIGSWIIWDCNSIDVW